MRISADMVNYKDQLVGYMPGRRAADRERAFFSIFSTMIGAVEMARMMSDAGARHLILGAARNFLLSAFSKGSRRCV
jgi:TetR/AcrR family transcriptional repressor of nem operon